jgi:hypothetical protein
LWVALLVVGAAGLGMAPARADDFVLGSGNGIATGVRVGPQTGGLTIAVTFGQALSDFQGRVGRASARAIDFGILETALTAPGCNGAPSSFKQSDFPQPLDADSRDPASVQGKTAQQGGTPDGPFFATVGRNDVKANGTPMGYARSTIAAFGLPGVLSVGSGVAEVTSRIIGDQTREVVGTVDFTSLDLLGTIHLGGLHWEAVQRTGKDATSEGSFSVSSMSVNGMKIPVSAGGTEAALVLAPINALLLGTGLSIDPPVLTTANAAADLAPLRIRIDHSPLGQAVVAPLVTAAQPVRQPLLDLYNGVMACESPVGATDFGKVGRGAVLPSDIALSALTGTGGFVIELGGVRATTEGQTFANPFEGGATAAGLGSDLGLGAVDAGGSSFSAGGTDTGGFTSAAPTTAGTTGSAPAAAVLGNRSVAATVPGAKGGAAATVGLLAVLGILSIAIADYLRMQRGQRVIPEVEP